MIQHQYAYNKIIFGYGLRNYIQSKAYFFKPEYTSMENYLAVDSKLNECYANELQLKLTLKSGLLSLRSSPSNISDITALIKIYHRHVTTPDWHSRKKDLFALIMNIGYRYHF